MSGIRHTGIAGAAAASLLHAAFLAILLSLPERFRPPGDALPPARVRLATAPEPPRPPAPDPVRATRARKGPFPAGPAPAEPPAPPPQAPRRFAVSMEATVPGGGVALPATSGAPGLRGDPAAPASAPAGDQPADATAVDRLPRLLGQPGSDAMRALYPEPARRDGLEGDVLLEILVSERGAVEDVRVARSAGHGFDEVARRLARQMRFEPAVRAGRPVSVWIPWTWKFRLDA